MKKRIKQSTLSKIIGFGTMAVLGASIIAFIFSLTLVAKVSELQNNRYELSTQAHLLKDSSRFLTNEVRAYASTGDVSHYDNYWEEVNDLKNRDHAVDAMKEIGLSDNELAFIQKIMDTSNNLIPLEEQAMELVQQNRLNEALQVLYGTEYQTGMDNVGSITDQFMETMKVRLENEINQYTITEKSVIVVTLVLIILLIIVQGANYVLMSKHIVEPTVKISEAMQEISKGNLGVSFDLTPDTSEIGMLTDAVIKTKESLGSYITEITEILQKIANGNLTYQVERNYVGDFTEIKKSLIYIAENLNHTINQIDDSADKVASGSEQIAVTAHHLTEGASEQASAVELLDQTVTKISSKVEQNAGNAQEAKEKVEYVGRTMAQTDEKMKHLVQAMQNINQSANEIEKIIKTIEDIAFQTNILALNAAVEAARAGVAGKGFAVVADEVRSLSGKSAEAANNTTELIEKAISAVKSGSQIADETASILVEAVDGTKEMAGIVNQIAIASTEQAESIMEVSKSLEQISQVVQTNSSTAEQSSEASENLAQYAETLRSLVYQFQLKK